MFKKSLTLLTAASLATGAIAQSGGGASGATILAPAGTAKNLGNMDPSIFQFIPTRDTPRSFAQYQVVMVFGRCASGAGTQEAKSSLETMPLSPNAQMMWRFIDKMGGCGPLPTHVDALVRGSLAEGLYHRQITAPLSPLKDDSDVDAFLEKLSDFNKLREPADITMSNVMGCFAATDPKDVDLVLAARHGSPEERKLLDKLFTSNASCGVHARPEQISLTFIRAFLAEATWRYAIFSGVVKPTA